MNKPRALWGTVLVLLSAAVVYRTLGMFREISALLDAPLFTTSATAPEIMALSLPLLLSPRALSAICLVLLVVLPAINEPHVLNRLGSRMRAVLVPARAGAIGVIAGVTIWIAIVAGLASRAPWSDHWGAVPGVATLADAFAPSIPEGSVTPLGLILLAVLNVSALYLAVSLWTGLAASYLTPRTVRIGLLGVALAELAGDLWKDHFQLNSWIGIQGVLHRMPPGLSTTTVLLVLALIPVAIAAIVDARRTGHVPGRRIAGTVLIAVVAYEVASLGSALGYTHSLGDALLLDLYGDRGGTGDPGSSPKISLFLTVQSFSFAPAVILLVRMEEMIQLWPMTRVRGAGTGKWLALLTREALGLSTLIVALPVVGILLAALGQPGALHDVGRHDLLVVAYWLVIGILQCTFYALTLALLRLVTASRAIWLIGIGTLLIAPLLIPTRWAPLGLNHLIVVDSYGPPALLISALTLIVAAAAVSGITHLLLTRRTINPEV